MPTPITDPLRLDPQDVSHAELNDPQHDEINRGMPARNYKMWGVVVGAACTATLLVWPAKPPSPPSQDAVAARGAGDPHPGAAVVAALKDDAEARARSVGRAGAGMPYEPSPAAGGGSAMGALFNPASASRGDQLTLEEKEEARRQSILASGTEASEVTIAATPAPQRESRLDQLSRDTAEQNRALNAQQMKLLDSIASGGIAGTGGSAGALGARGSSANVLASSSNEEFMGRVGVRGVEAAQHVTAARSGLALYQGTIVRTVLDKAINTDLPGSVRAHVTSDVFDSISGTRLMIPRGAVVVGDYSTGLVVGQDRVLVALSRLILPNGQSVGLMGTPASDGQGVSGLFADIDNHFLKMFGASAMVGAASLLLPRQQQNITVNVGNTGGTQTGGTVFATTLQQAIQQMAQRNMNIKPTGTVELGEPFTFTLARDIIMDEYKGPGR